MVASALMKEKLLSLEDAYERLSETEPLGVVRITNEDNARFYFDPDWALTLNTTHGSAPVAASVEVNGVIHQLSKDAALTAASAFGLPAAHAKQLPAHLMEAEMNYWFGSGMGNREFNLLTTGAEARASAFVKPSKQPFSNLSLLSAIERRLRERLGNTEILVDYKFNHSLLQTDLRLVLPDAAHVISGTDTSDDEWCAGIHLSNSLTAASQTSIESYLFRWVCTNGATSQYGGSGRWNRKVGGQNEPDVLQWARVAVDEIFESFPQKWVELQKLTQINIEGNAEEIIRTVFKTYGVPVTQQNEIISSLLESDNLTMYALMQSITQLANNPLLRPERADTLMRIGGSIPTALFDPLNRKLWDEGHSAPAQATNPYEV